MYTLKSGDTILTTQETPILYDEKQKSWITDKAIYSDSEKQFIVSTLITNRYITQLAFISRFTDEEAIDIDLASQGTTVDAATLRRYQNKINAAKFIDLDLTETRNGVLALESVGLLEPGRALVILDTPIQDSERP